MLKTRKNITLGNEARQILRAETERRKRLGIYPQTESGLIEEAILKRYKKNHKQTRSVK